jgi:hypothetical protein
MFERWQRCDLTRRGEFFAGGCGSRWNVDLMGLWWSKGRCLTSL